MSQIPIKDIEEDQVGQQEDNDQIDTVTILVRGFGHMKLGINTSAVEDKVTACRMIYEYVSELKELFYPYVEKVASVVIPLVSWKYSEDVRSVAALTCAPLLHSAIKGLVANGHPLDGAVQLLNMILVKK